MVPFPTSSQQKAFCIEKLLHLKVPYACSYMLHNLANIPQMKSTKGQ